MQNEMRDRFAEIVQDGLFQHAHYVAKERQRALETETEAEHSEIYDNIKSLHEFVADHLIENGVIVPPCKVGDVVYCEYGEKIISGKVRLIRPFISKNDVVFKGNIICELESPFYDDGRKEKSELYVVFGRKWGIERIAYFTKEQAEQKLKGGADNGNL